MEQAANIQELSNNQILVKALEFYVEGIVPLPVNRYRQKAPAVSSWTQYQKERPSKEQVLEWFLKADGLGVLCGTVSGNLLMIELEGRAATLQTIDLLTHRAKENNILDLFEKLNSGYVERSPSGGLHWLLKSQGPIPGNEKFARRIDENGVISVLAESRGEGGFVVVAPTSGLCHPTGNGWHIIKGNPKSIPTFSEEEVDALRELFISLDEMPKEQFREPITRVRAEGQLLPGDAFNQSITWDELLIADGWTKLHTDSMGKTDWRRPGKDYGISATTNYQGNDLFHVFTSSVALDSDKSYSKFAYVALTKFGGDFNACANALRQQGYGQVTELTAFNSATMTQPYSNEQGSVTGGLLLSPLEIELEKQRIRKEAAAILKEEEASKTYKEPLFIRDLAKELELPETEVQWVIRDIFPQGANISVTAQYKAGKTTLINALAKSLADGEKFLEYFQEPIHQRRIVIFNYEVSENQYRRWMKDVSIKHADHITLVHLRGERLPLISERVQKLVIDILKDLDCQTWIVDPFARAFVGSGDENSNSDVGLFLDTLDFIKKQANVDNLVLPMHTGRAQEHGIDRARGATRLDDWADVRWLLSKTDEGRFFSADGRDVLLEQQALAFDEATRSLRLGGASAKVAKKMAMEDAFVQVVKENPGITTNQVFELMSLDPTSKPMRAAMKSALHYKRVKVKAIGTAKVWYPIEYLQTIGEA
jgi:hypothetical protein